MKHTVVIDDNFKPVNDLSLEAEWYAFRTQTLPPSATPAQLADMKVAFFSGVSAMVGVMERLSQDDVTEEQGQQTLERIAEEALAFAASFGRADATPH